MATPIKDWSKLEVRDHDNATLHSTNLTQQWLQRYGWEILHHPTHSPNLAASDFHLSGPLKRHLGSMAFGQKVTSSMNGRIGLHIVTLISFELTRLLYPESLVPHVVDTHVCLTRYATGRPASHRWTSKSSDCRRWILADVPDGRTIAVGFKDYE
ncbi:histone-lysine N-methyltransferase SETMAR [Elysia marginata]|uniref:Histone-lysine N-methyltransferase SETMAR n=1 Tax=Elysia marginata TaxID=1093978 RepID=A0AAV4F5T7_9GAST|nr:histone-lysine N-methyltransferase SETMAR [Elysia marginata]